MTTPDHDPDLLPATPAAMPPAAIAGAAAAPGAGVLAAAGAVQTQVADRVAGAGRAGALARTADRLDRWSDRLDPLLIRFVRQELRSQIFIAIFIIVLVVACLFSLAFAGSAQDGQRQDAGLFLYASLGGILSFALWVAMPLRVFMAMARERDDDTWDLIQLTRLGPMGVIRGMLIAGQTQAMLITAAMAPFMLMAYQLRGIDLLTMLVTLVAVMVIGLALNAVAVFTAALGVNKPLRIALGLLLALALLGGYLVVCLNGWARFEGITRDLRWLWTNESTVAWLLLGVWTNVAVAMILVLIVLAAALLTARVADRSTGPRTVWWIVWGNLAAWMIGVILYAACSSTGPGDWDRFLFGLSMFFGGAGLAWSVALGFFSCTEDQTISPRQAQSLQQGPRWRRPFSWMIGPGVARGRLCYVVMSTLSLVPLMGCIVFGLGASGYMRDGAYLVPLMWVYANGYLIIGDGISRHLLGRWIGSPPARRALVLCTLAAGCVLPPVLTWLIDDNPFNGDGAELLVAWMSPGQGAMAFVEIVGASRTNQLVVAMGLGLMSVAVIFVQGLRLGVRTQAVRARAGDNNPRS